MKLSEAILKGCEKSRPIKGAMFRYGNNIGTCALGSALLTTGYFKNKRTYNEDAYRHLKEEFPIANKRMNLFPRHLWPVVDDTWKPGLVYQVIYNLNDRHNWSREAIAMWVSTLEDYLETQTHTQHTDDSRQTTQRSLQVHSSD